MKSKIVMKLAEEIRLEYLNNRDSNIIESKIIAAKEQIALSGEELDDEDKVILDYNFLRTHFYKKGVAFPIDVLDQYVKIGHLASIDYRLDLAPYHPISQEIADIIKSHVSRVFKSNNKKLITGFSHELTRSYDRGNPLGLSYEQNDKFDYLEEQNRFGGGRVKINDTAVFGDEFSIQEWKNLITTLLDINQTLAINEPLTTRFFPITDELHVAVPQYGELYQETIDITYRNHTLANISVDFDDDSQKSLMTIIREIRNHLVHCANRDQTPGPSFISELEPINNDVDWLNLPEKHLEMKFVLFGTINQ